MNKQHVRFLAMFFVFAFAGFLVLSLGSSLLINEPPTTPTFLLCDGESCTDGGSFTESIELQCGGSTDPENNEITYFIDAYYNVTDPVHISIDHFSNGLTEEELTFNFEGGDIVRYLELPRSANVVSADLDLQGIEGSAFLEEDLVAYWRFEELEGPVVDSVKGLHNGVNNGAIRGVEGVMGNAFEFDKDESDFVQVDHHFDFAFADNDFSVAGWFNSKNILEEGGPIGKFYPGGNDAQHWEILFGNSPGKISFLLQSGASTGFIHSGDDFESDTWYHVALVVDQPDEARLYVNGIEQASTDISFLDDLSAPDQLGIGRPFHTGNPPYFDGLIDEVGIWTRSLTEEEILEMYDNNGLLLLINNPYLEVGTPDGVYEWNFEGEFNQSVETEDLSDAINLALNNGECDCDGCSVTEENSCLVPFLFHSDSSGILEYSDIEVTYQISNEYFWLNIGSHFESSSLNWNIEEIMNQSGVDLRCNAIDFQGSGEFSDYYNPVIDITIGNPPVLDPVGDQVVEEIGTLIIQLTASDPDEDELTFGTDAEDVLPSQFFFDSETGLFIWTPNYQDAGEYFVTFSVSDGQLSDFEVVEILVIESCPADIDGNGIVGTADLLLLLGAWGDNPGHPADIDGNGVVGSNDLIILLGSWGPCGAQGAQPFTPDETREVKRMLTDHFDDEIPSEIERFFN